MHKYLYFERPLTLNDLEDYLLNRHNIQFTDFSRKQIEHYEYYDMVMVTSSGARAGVKFYPRAYNTDEQESLIRDYDRSAVTVSSILEISMGIFAEAFPDELLDKILADLGGGYRLERMACGRRVTSNSNNDLHITEMCIADKLIKCAKVVRDPYHKTSDERDVPGETPRLSERLVSVSSVHSRDTTSKFTKQLIDCAASLMALAEIEEHFGCGQDVQECIKRIQKQLMKIHKGEAISQDTQETSFFD